jgi:hypothetical protein
MCQNPPRSLEALSLSHTTASRTAHTSAPRCTLSAATAKSSGHRLLAAVVGWRWRSRRFLLVTAPTTSSPPPSSDLAGPRAWSHPHHCRGGNLPFVLLTAPPLLPVTTSSSPPHSPLTYKTILFPFLTFKIVISFYTVASFDGGFCYITLCQPFYMAATLATRG